MHFQSVASLTSESEFVLQESGKLLIRPYIEELPELFVSYFKEILRVGYNIPRLEFYMSQGEHDILLTSEHTRIDL